MSKRLRIVLVVMSCFALAVWIFLVAIKDPPTGSTSTPLPPPALNSPVGEKRILTDVDSESADRDSMIEYLLIEVFDVEGPPLPDAKVFFATGVERCLRASDRLAIGSTDASGRILWQKKVA
jgi:hypothetical protein